MKDWKLFIGLNFLVIVKAVEQQRQKSCRWCHFQEVKFINTNDLHICIYIVVAFVPILVHLLLRKYATVEIYDRNVVKFVRIVND